MFLKIFLIAALFGATDERTAHWCEDLQVLTTTLSAKGHSVDFQRGLSTRGQIDFEKLYPHFRSDIDALEADISKLSDGEIVLRLMKIIAGANVDHNRVFEPVALGFFSRLPVVFNWFADGLAITSASEEYQAALGARVLKIGAKTPDQVLSELAPYISHENEPGLRQSATGLLRCRIVLDHLGVADFNGNVMLTLEKPDGTSFPLTIKTTDPRVKWISMFAALHLPSTLTLSHPQERYYWHQYLEDTATLYIQYNSCANDPKLPFSEFAAKVLADADAHSLKRVVIDLRNNPGGNSLIIRPLKNGLHSRLNRLGHVYVLIGPRTASSGVLNALEFRSSLNATLVGEPTGEKPSGYGEVKTVTLPNSKLKVAYSTKFFGSKNDSNNALAPDILAPRKLADVLAGRDAALEAALAAPPSAPRTSAR